MISVGVKLAAAFGDPGEFLADAAALELAGVDSLWISESVLRPVDLARPYSPELEPWTLLGALAAVTSRVRLGTSVSVAAMWPPALFAAKVNTLEHLSRGRMVVGVGAGWEPYQFLGTGQPFEGRGRRLDEFLEAVRHLWSGKEEPFGGSIYQLPALRIVPGVRPHGPPVLVGAFGEAGYRRAARQDGFIHGGGKPEHVDAVFRKVLDFREQLGLARDCQLWAQVRAPRGREDWRQTLALYEELGATGVIVNFNERLLDLLRNPDQEDDRSDLLIAQG